MEKNEAEVEMEKLSENLDNLSEEIKHTNSFRFLLMRGIIIGVGTFIGATIIAAIVLTVLLKVLGYVGIRPYVERYIPQSFQSPFLNNNN